MSITTGYSESDIRSLVEQVQELTTRSCEKIVNTIDNSIIEPISTTWYTPEGLEYWKGFREEVKNQGEEVKKSFENFTANISGAQKSWAENTGAEQIKLDGAVEVKLEINIDSIKAKDNDRVGINEDEARAVATSLPSVQQKLVDELVGLKNELSGADNAFLGHEQGAAIRNYFETILKAVANIFDFLLNTDKNSVSKQIDAAVEKYAKVATNTADTFNE